MSLLVFRHCYFTRGIFCWIQPSVASLCPCSCSQLMALFNISHSTAVQKEVSELAGQLCFQHQFLQLLQTLARTQIYFCCSNVIGNVWTKPSTLALNLAVSNTIFVFFHLCQFEGSGMFHAHNLPQLLSYSYTSYIATKKSAPFNTAGNEWSFVCCDFSLKEYDDLEPFYDVIWSWDRLKIFLQQILYHNFFSAGQICLFGPVARKRITKCPKNSVSEDYCNPHLRYFLGIL